MVGIIAFLWTVLTSSLVSFVVIQSVEQRIVESTRRPESVFCLLLTEPENRDPEAVSFCWADPPDTLDAILERVEAERLVPLLPKEGD